MTISKMSITKMVYPKEKSLAAFNALRYAYEYVNEVIKGIGIKNTKAKNSGPNR